MNRITHYASVSLVIIQMIVVGCSGNGSGKSAQSSLGSWSEDDKAKFRTEIGQLDELEIFGDNKEAWIECYLSKCEANYDSFKDADMDAEGAEKLALECNQEVLGIDSSGAGGWSEEDRKSFRAQLALVDDALSIYGEDKDRWIECYLSKCEANYASFAEADADTEGCQKLAMECNEEIISN